MSNTDGVVLAVDAAGAGRLTLDRPEKHNAFDERLIAAIAHGLRTLAEDAGVCCVVIAANGRSFSAGADLEWMHRMGEASHQVNVADAMALAEMLRLLDTLPKPTIAAVQGPAYGGGVGIVAACDIAIAAEGARFAMTEVRLGLIPAVISPHVLRAIGERQARRYFVSGEAFDAETALRVGLVHKVVPAASLAKEVDGMVKILAANGREAMAEVKDLIRTVTGRPLDRALMAETAERIARARASDEGRARIARFLSERRKN
jgi:methylglutaconyl-CoA hydratase